LKPIYISAINYVLGEPHPLTELSDPALLKLASPQHGLVSYLSSDQEIWQLAAAAGKRTIEAGPQPDLLIYVSENQAEIAAALPLAVGRLGLGTTEYVSVAGHGCGNLGPALRVARDALYSGQHDQVLLILADRVLDGDRSMINGLSVLSDGAASCLGHTRGCGESGWAIQDRGVNDCDEDREQRGRSRSPGSPVDRFDGG